MYAIPYHISSWPHFFHVTIYASIHHNGITYDTTPNLLMPIVGSQLSRNKCSFLSTFGSLRVAIDDDMLYIVDKKLIVLHEV